MLSDGIKMIIQASYQLQRDITNLMLSPFSEKGDAPRLTAKMALDMAEYAAGTAAALLPQSDERVAWLELQNKLEAFNLFSHVDLELDSCGQDCTLIDLVTQASQLGPYRSVWATEGVGHFYAESQRTSGLNLGAGANALPRASMTALHSGLGLSLANRCLETVTTRSTDAQIRAALKQFFALCDANSHESYAGATYEALGLTTRNLYPHLIADIDFHLAEMDQELVAYFWHGVGRAIYFAPTNFLPDANNWQRLLEQAHEEVLHELGRTNVLSGLIWALVLVNIRHPKVLEAFVRVNVRDLNPEVFENALCSAALIWRDSSPGDESLRALCSYRPADAELAAVWRAHVSGPCLVMLEQYTALSEKGLGRLFRHRPLSELVSKR